MEVPVKSLVELFSVPWHFSAMTNRKRTKEARTRGAENELAPARGRSRSRIKRMRGAMGFGGRPSEYHDDILPAISLMARKGATIYEMAQAFGVTSATIHRWANENQQFFDAVYTNGKEAFDERIKRSLAERAAGYTYEAEKVFSNGLRVKTIEHVPPDVAAAKYWLAVRDPEWRERQTIDLDADVQVENSDERQLALAVLAMLQKATRGPMQEIDAIAEPAPAITHDEDEEEEPHDPFDFAG